MASEVRVVLGIDVRELVALVPKPNNLNLVGEREPTHTQQVKKQNTEVSTWI